jgi:sarcosine oxidase
MLKPLGQAVEDVAAAQLAYARAMAWAGECRLFDCAVVGAGVFGSWTALRLRESGRSVVLVDAFGPGNPKSSSGGASRVIRMGYGADEIYTRWAMRSLAAWQELFERYPADLFQHTGVLWTARRGHPHGGNAGGFSQAGCAHESLSAAEVRRAIRRCDSMRTSSAFSSRKAAHCWPIRRSGGSARGGARAWRCGGCGD